MLASRRAVFLVKRVLPTSVFDFVKQTIVRGQTWYFRVFDRFHNVSVRNKTILIGVSSKIESFRARSYSSKEPETLDWIDSILRPGDVFYDIGANVGLYSLYAAVSQPGAKILAFEPHPVNFQRLCRNILANRLSNVLPCSIALTDKLNFDTFHVSGFEAGIAFNSVGQLNDLRNSEHEIDHLNVGIGIIATSIDKFISQLNAPSPNLIKLDVDGNEDAIISGAMQTLAKESVRSVLVEVNCKEHETTHIEKILTDLGFKVSVRGEVIRRDQVVAQNVIFVRK